MVNDLHRQMATIGGRTVAWVEAGDVDGLPVFHLHGAGMSRLEALIFDVRARAAGVRLIGPDRPGCGFSDPRALLTPVQYADDLAALADHLGIDRFIVSGVSSGGMYAMAAASALPDRVAGVVPINSATPTFDPTVRDHVTGATRVAYFMANRMPRVITTLTGAFSARLVYDSTGDESVKLPLGMSKLFQDPVLAQQFGRAQAESGRQPNSNYMRNELKLVSAPWGFDHTAISQRVEMFSGDKDGGYRYAQRWASSLPNARLNVFPGPHGAFALPPAPEQIVTAMAALAALAALAASKAV